MEVVREEKRSSSWHRLFPVPEEIEMQAHDLLEALSPVVSPAEKIENCGPGGPYVLGAIEVARSDFAQILEMLFDIMNEEKVEALPGIYRRLRVALYALEGKIRYLEDIQKWFELTWEYDPAILALCKKDKSVAK